MSSYTTCRKCGGRVAIRRHAWHWRAGRLIRAKRAKALVIHVDGTCGQLLLPLK